MNPLLVALLVAVSGGVGSVVRFVVDSAVRARFGTAYPWGTTVINVSGSFLLGLVTALALGALLSADWRFVLGTGLLGGYTTFSTASFETVRLVQVGRYGPALANGLGMLVLSVALAALGFWVGTLMAGS
ncbi:fluoride efflux transporter CrcB [Subtercola boreus]|uniref:Fluoride-specific ion channel FluC n=1 Tax=Subtercola boreus TaxID=120213 RepID=A0A3E0WB83_9MICO|nr:fluoride efflux transporter CrcB [Subtercola boreus]RFA20617.1 chromosome condensation protein CrcB [Subtercola boreus]RFA20731.1 chromosome condensation protein CrcB [Subtercola boreus]RFA26942.1 chromosome condensation protein CrcB [Subtercola boreus]